jgi:acyl carrier protein
MDLDLEADLGVDTVKQAEVFAAVREAYGIARQENLKLRDFPTLAHVVKFVYDYAPAGAVAPAGSLSLPPIFPPPGKAPLESLPGGPSETAPTDLPSSTPHPSSPAPDATPTSGGKPAPTEAPRNDVVGKILEIVADKTGYPQDMLEMDLDLEADLGVDTVKQAEVFAAVREAYGIARQENLKLRDFPTLKHVVQFVYDYAPAGAVAPAGSPVLPPVFPPQGKAPLEGSPGGLSEMPPKDLPSSTPHSSSPVSTELSEWRRDSPAIVAKDWY